MGGGGGMGGRAVSVNVQQHLVAGGLAGAASRTATAPLGDAAPADDDLGYAGLLATGTARELWRESGWRAFFRGNLLSVLRAAPQKAIDFGAFEDFQEPAPPTLPQLAPRAPPRGLRGTARAASPRSSCTPWTRCGAACWRRGPGWGRASGSRRWRTRLSL